MEHGTLPLDALCEGEGGSPLNSLDSHQRGRLATGLAAHGLGQGVESLLRFVVNRQSWIELRSFTRTSSNHDLPYIAERFLQELIRDNMVDNSATGGVGRGNHVAGGAHLGRLGDTTQTREALRPVGPWDKTNLHFWLAKLGIRCGDAVVTGKCEFHPASQAGPVDGSHDGLGAVFSNRQQVRQGSRKFGVSRDDSCQFLDVSTGYERPSSTDNHDGLQRLILVRLFNAGGKGLGNSTL